MTGTTDQLTESLRPTTAVEEFVSAVRDHLCDLPAAERDELTEGLEADLGDLVAEHGTDALGDPAVYADELRVAAGHGEAPAVLGRDRGLRGAAGDALDAAHASWDRLLDALPADLGGLVRALQPVWWVTRGWVAWMVVQDVRSQSSAIVVNGPWLVLLAVLVVLSIQLGRRSWGTARLLAGSLLARVVLVGLNVLAVGMAPGASSRLAWHVADSYAWQLTAQDTEPSPSPASAEADRVRVRPAGRR